MDDSDSSSSSLYNAEMDYSDFPQEVMQQDIPRYSSRLEATSEKFFTIFEESSSVSLSEFVEISSS